MRLNAPLSAISTQLQSNLALVDLVSIPQFELLRPFLVPGLDAFAPIPPKFLAMTAVK